MIELAVSQLKKSYGSVVVLDDVSLEIMRGEHVALVGANGAGKTTLFRLLCGEELPDAGRIDLPGDAVVGLLSQIPSFPDGFSVEDVLRTAFAPLDALSGQMERLAGQMKTDAGRGVLMQYDRLLQEYNRLGGNEREVSLAKIRQGLQIDDAMFARGFASLSGGEKTRVNLARMLLTNTTLFLLDEPTNHLDLRATQWLEAFIAKSSHTFVVVSHDRYFLDRVATRVWELENGRAVSYAGNYSAYAEQKAHRLREQQARYEWEQKKTGQLLDVARRMHDYAGKNAKLHKRAFAMEKRAARIAVTDRPSKEKKLKGGFAEAAFHADDVLRVENLRKSYDVPLFSGVTLSLRGGERVGVIGDNGAGKTTFLRILIGQLPPDRGSVWQGPSVRTAYLPQHVQFTHPERTLLETLQYEQDEDTQTARNRLGRFHFQGEDVYKRVCDLSGGEKSRLVLCMLMNEEVNLLCLDEPTNHLDIASRTFVEEAVASFGGTLVFISHDRYFLSRFATRLWVFEGGQVRDFVGGYDAYEAWRQAVPETSAPKKETPKEEKKKTSPHSRIVKEMEKQLKLREREIAALEEELAAVQGEMERCATEADTLQQLLLRQAQMESERDMRYEQWLALHIEWENSVKEV